MVISKKLYPCPLNIHSRSWLLAAEEVDVFATKLSLIEQMVSSSVNGDEFPGCSKTGASAVILSVLISRMTLKTRISAEIS